MEQLLLPYLNPTTLLACAVIAFAILIAIAVHMIMTAPRRATEEMGDVVNRLDAMTQRLSEAERIGKFGSFAWNFENTYASFWSPEMYDLCGLVPHPGAPSIEVFLTTIHEQDRKEVAEKLLAAQHHMGPFSIDLRTVAPSGEVRYLHVQGKSTLAGDSPRFLEGVARDVTREKDVDKAKTEFVSLASHQLKTPLTSISWLTEMLLSEKAGALSPQQHEYLARVHANSVRMVEMVNELLNISRIELGTLAVTIASFDICALLRDVYEEQHHAAETRKITVKLICGSALPSMQGDQGLARMILQNLLSNAIKYSKDGGAVECEISSGEVNDSVMIRVSDRGIGIPKEDQGRVFERLHRASNARAQVADGTGLGLYVIKLVAERVKGKVSFTSQEGTGTTFYVSLPLQWPSPETTTTE